MNTHPVTPRGFLVVGGFVLLLVGLLGYFGILIGPTPMQSVFGNYWYFDNAENFAHTFLGVVALLAAFLLKDVMVQKWLVVAVGALAILVALLNFHETVIFGANLESPADMLLHLVVGVWALWAAFKPMRAKTK